MRHTTQHGFGLLSLLVLIALFSIVVSVIFDYSSNALESTREDTNTINPIDEAEQARDIINQRAIDIGERI